MLEKRLSQKLLHNGYFLKFVEDDIEIDTKPPISGKRQYLIHPGGVCIVPVLDNGELVMIKQFRTPVEEVIYEFPAGKIDHGEDPFETAKRELKEETGYTATEWIDCGATYPCPGYSTEKLYLYIAKGLSPGETNLDHGEVIDTFKISREEALEKAKNGEIKDGKTLNGLLYLSLYSS